MRISALVLAALLVTAATGLADEAKCLAAVKELELKVAPESTASWDERNEAYKKAKALMKKYENEACAAAYESITEKVANGLRRESVPLSGWLMGLFGAGLMWGGMTICIMIAMKSGRSGTEED